MVKQSAGRWEVLGVAMALVETKRSVDGRCDESYEKKLRASSFISLCIIIIDRS